MKTLRKTPFTTAPGSMMGQHRMMGPGAGYGGMMGPAGGYGGMTGRGAMQAPHVPCSGQGVQNDGSCESGGRGAYPSPHRQALPFWQ